MREIEFRAWLKKEYYSVLNPENKIYRVENLNFDNNEAYLSECGWYSFDDIELMQYTGLKDKNGVKIFEGDIVNVDNKYICYIEYDVNNGCHLIVNDKGRWTNILTKERAKRCEVIGNIYENKELLEDNKNVDQKSR